MLRQNRTNIIIFYIITAAALTAAAFIDLQLDIKLNSPENPFAIWFQNTGEIPCRLICPLAGTVLFYTCKSRFGKTAGFLIAIGGSVYLGYYIGKYFFIEENRMAFSIVWGLGFGIVTLITGKYIKIPEIAKKPLMALAIAGIAVMAVQLIAVEGLKYLWGRVRFRDLIAQGSYDAFTPWYQINGINSNKSFPSGHTAGAGMSYLLMLLPCAFSSWKSKKNICFWVALIYTGIVAFTRLVMGAHYLSDVAAGGLISFTIVIITMKIFEKVAEKHPKITC